MTYLLVYSDSTGSREFMVDVLDSLHQVSRWRYDMPNSFYIKSSYSAQELVDAIVDKLCSHERRFLIVEVNDNRQGYLTRKTWDFLNSK